MKKILLNCNKQDYGINYQKGGVSKIKILIAAGGSGGHIFPAIALAKKLQNKKAGIDIRFVGSNKTLDRRIFEKEGFKFSLLSANKLPYGMSIGLVIFFIKLIFDTIKAFFIVVGYRPNAVVGFGGYVSFPVMVAAYIFGIPKIAHEQNVVPGRANKLLFRLADKVAISFDATKNYMGKNSKKCVFTGNPIRTESFKDDRPFGIKRFGLDPSKFTLLVIGGSQGSHFLNETFIESLRGLDVGIKSALQVIHITGVKDYEWAVSAYEKLGVENRTHSFIDRIEEAYSASDLVITRSGASAIFELAFFGRPMILVPYPFAMSHQAENARFFYESGAAIELDEKALSPELFQKTVTSLFKDRTKLTKLAGSAKSLGVPQAADNLSDQVLELVKI